MMRKLRALQGDLDDRADALARREAQVKMLEAEKDAALKRLRNAEGTRHKKCSTPVPRWANQCETL